MEHKSQISTTRRSSIEGHEQDTFGGATFSDPLCKLNLKETSDFVKAFPMSCSSVQRTREEERINVSNLFGNRKLEGPTTPGRPFFFTFSPGHVHRKNVPSKWEDAEKWLVNNSSSCHESPLNNGVRKLDPSKISSQSLGGKLAEPKVSKAPNVASGEVLLKDKFTESTEPAKETFMFKSSIFEPIKEVNKRDVGTEMTPLGSSKTSRCTTPIISTSPARHNTPEGRSGPLVPYNSSFIDVSELKDCNFSKFESMVSNWSSKEEEEEEVSKSLRHFEMNGDESERKNVVECRANVWEEEERTKSCIRYQREEAKIQAWVNLESAKAEAQSRKLEVKIQKMRSNLEEKLMKRMTNVHRKAEEWRASAQVQHLQQLQKASENAHKMKNSRVLGRTSCSCFPCNNNLI